MEHMCESVFADYLSQYGYFLGQSLPKRAVDLEHASSVLSLRDVFYRMGLKEAALA